MVQNYHCVGIPVNDKNEPDKIKKIQIKYTYRVLINYLIFYLRFLRRFLFKYNQCKQLPRKLLMVGRCTTGQIAHTILLSQPQYFLLIMMLLQAPEMKLGK